MIKKVLNFNSPFDVSYDTAKSVKEAHYSFKAGEDHYCYYRTWGWHQVIASLMEGLMVQLHKINKEMRNCFYTF